MPWSNGLTKAEFDALALSTKPGVYSAGDVLFREGETPEHVHLVVSGKVNLTRQTASSSRPQIMCSIEPGGVLAEQDLVDDRESATTATVAEDHTFCLLLDKNDYALAPSRKHRIEKSGMSQRDDIALADLTVKTLVGAGAFAQVALVRHATSKELFALKKMNRKHLESEKVTSQVLNERFVLGDFHHPCIARLQATFKSRLSLFMLLEPCMGGELFSRMRKLRRLEEPIACFYSACVVSAFEYLQSRYVLYRDLKPENIMIHADGYVRVVDFGFAKRVYGRTYTVCGTPEYLAPEILMMKGHGHGVDWWALGVLLYEMVVGVAPFSFHPETKKPDADLPPPELYKNILNPRYELPFPQRLSTGICEAIEQLLAWDPLTRIGCLTDGPSGVKRLAFFNDIHWGELYDRKITPPFIPELKADDDVTNFEELEASDLRFLAEPPYDLEDAWDINF